MKLRYNRGVRSRDALPMDAAAADGKSQQEKEKGFVRSAAQASGVISGHEVT